MGLGTIALRRIPCHCAACRRQMNSKWDKKIVNVIQQPRFADVLDCRFRQFLSDRNKWHFAKLEQRSVGHKDCHEFMGDDANLLRAELRDMIGNKMMLTIQAGNFGL